MQWNAVCTDEEFVALWKEHGSASKIAKILGVNDRAVTNRRSRMEKRLGMIFPCYDKRSNRFEVTIPNNGVRVQVELDDGVIMVASDCHYWPNTISTAHRAFVKIIKELKPKMVVINGDAFDGAGISRHPAQNWSITPSGKEELEACHDRLGEIEKVAGNAKMHWTWGNHDLRFNARLAQQVGDAFKDVQGMNLTDHFPRWKFSTSVMVNDHTMIKHRWHNGIHAQHNNVLKAGTSIVTGHLHSLGVRAYTDYKGTRYAVDTGTLANPFGDQFEYAEDNPKNHRSGFAVLTFYNGKLMPPELCEVVSEDAGLVYFRGEVIKV